MTRINVAQLANFNQATVPGPCGDCEAFCCRVLAIHLETPTTFMDFDYVRFLLNFDRVGVGVKENNEWAVLFQSVCGNLDQATNLCTVHGTPEQPQTCVYYNPHTCWYKENLSGRPTNRLVNMTPEVLDRLLGEMVFGPDGRLLTVPTFERAMSVARPIIEEI